MHRLYVYFGTVHTISVTGQNHDFSELYSEFSYFFEPTNNVEVWPVKAFLEQLWAGKVF
jgi:hypothetical protein